MAEHRTRKGNLFMRDLWRRAGTVVVVMILLAACNQKEKLVAICNGDDCTIAPSSLVDEGDMRQTCNKFEVEYKGEFIPAWQCGPFR